MFYDLRKKVSRSGVLIAGGVLGVALVVGAFLFLRTGKILIEEPPFISKEGVSLANLVVRPSSTVVALPSATSSPGMLPLGQAVKLFSAQALGASPVYDFSMYVPASWKTQGVRSIESLNFYEAGQVGLPIGNSRMFVRYFQANSFLTLSSVKVLSRKNIIISGRPAVDYVIEKKPGYPNFPGQPLWRNGRHRVVDVKVSDSAQALFYVFAKSPDLADEVFDAMLDTLTFSPKDLLFYPVDGTTWLSGESLSGAVTKKPFGIFITPTNSPVTPEKFTGYHTGIDVEIPNAISATASIPVLAIADGVVVRSGKAQGYGGIVAIRHDTGGTSLLAVYGHLNPKSLAKLGASVKAGQIIGVLGRAFSPETDGGRRHLHFGLYKGQDMNIAGYVERESELQSWLDPLKFFAERMP